MPSPAPARRPSATAQDFYELSRRLRASALLAAGGTPPRPSTPGSREKWRKSTRIYTTPGEVVQLPTSTTYLVASMRTSDEDMGDEDMETIELRAARSRRPRAATPSAEARNLRSPATTRAAVARLCARTEVARMRYYPSAWALTARARPMKKRGTGCSSAASAACHRRHDAQHLSPGVRLKLSDGKSHVELPGRPGLEALEGFLGASEEEKGPGFLTPATREDTQEDARVREIGSSSTVGMRQTPFSNALHSPHATPLYYT